MENYVIYDELGADDHSVVFKGRRKGTIEFVAVHRVDKQYRACVTNAVRLLHNLKHSNILRFSEWYGKWYIACWELLSDISVVVFQLSRIIVLV